MRVVLATHNQHKVVELTDALAAADFQVEGLRLHPEVGEIEETGDTFEANAILKASEVARITGLAAIADDSGLEVDALGGEPGVRSARFAGERARDADNREALVNALKALDLEGPFSARFVCVLALALPSGEAKTVTGHCGGAIHLIERGGFGFGYDALFVAHGDTKTFAELEPLEKRRKSHRALALARVDQLAEWARGR